MKREASLLLNKSMDSLLLAVEHFNRPSDTGRVSSVLILLDHSFEMLLKASILHNGGKIREPRARETIGFDACVRRSLGNASIKFLSEDQALTLQAINGLRDAAQHHLVDVSEQQLYMLAQSGLSLYRDILFDVFSIELHKRLPSRVLPISTMAPLDIGVFFDQEVEEVKRLLTPGRRKRTEAFARLRPLAIFDLTLQGDKLQPSYGELERRAASLAKGEPWDNVFPGAASVQVVTEGAGATISFRITKKEGLPIHTVPEGTPGASVVAVRRVDELGFYSMGRDQVAKKVELSGPKTTAAIWYLDLKSDPDCYKRVTVGKVIFDRYSIKAAERIQELLSGVSAEVVWKHYRSKVRPEMQATA